MNITVKVSKQRPIETAIRSRISKIYNEFTGERLHSVSKQVRLSVRPGSALAFANDKPFARFRFADSADLRGGNVTMEVKALG